MSNGFKASLLILVVLAIGVVVLMQKVNSPNTEISADDQAKMSQQLRPIQKKQ